MATTMSFHQLIVILSARWRIVVGVFLAFVLLVMAVTFIWPKQYTATASVVIDAKSDPVASAGNAGGAGGQQISNYVNTQADIIGSERVAQRVVKTLRLDQQPEARKLWAQSPDEDISIRIAHYLLEKKVTVAPSH